MLRDSRDTIPGRPGQQEDPTLADNIPQCPVFYPTTEEFTDFTSYVEKCVSQIGTTGIFKVSTLSILPLIQANFFYFVSGCSAEELGSAQGGLSEFEIPRQATHRAERVEHGLARRV